MTAANWFDNEVALVTGAGAGIGRAVALAFASQGARVVVADRRLDWAAETVRLVHGLGAQALAVQSDVTVATDVQAMVARAVEHFGGLNFAVNNAGIEGAVFVPVADYAESVWDDVIGVNLKGVFLCMKYQLPHLVASRGAIVNTASVAGLSGGRMGSAYYASKHGVVGLTRAAAMEYADKGVRVNAVAPGVIRTDMAERAFVQTNVPAARIDAMHPLGRMGTAQEVANAIVWLCSANASFITGHTLPVDGGFLVP